jgi:hypothetical protein
MIELTNTQNITGSTYSSEHYDAFKISKDKDIFESVIDGLILENYSNDEELKDIIKNLPKENKRIGLLSLIGNDNVLWNKINNLLKDNKSSFQYLKEIILILREYVKIADVDKKSKGEVLTPFNELAKPMVNLVEKYDADFWKNKNHKVLDSSAGYGTFLILAAYKFMVGLKDEFPDEEERFKWIVENCLYYGELQAKSVFSWLLVIDPYDKYQTNTYWGSFLDDSFDKHAKDVWNVTKWDLIIQNPPFQNGIHIHFFNKSFDLLSYNKLLIFVHPSTPFINRKPSREDNKTKKIKKIIQEFESYITLIDGNKVFDAGFFTPLSITSIKKVLLNDIEVTYSHIDQNNKELKIYDNLSYINIHGCDIVNKISKKIKDKTVFSIEDKLYRNGNISKIGMYFKICRISGHPPKKSEKMINPDFFQLVYKENENDSINLITNTPIGKRSDGNQFNELIINDVSEIEKIHKYLMTKFARFCLSIYKNSANILSDLKIVPYMDFSRFWSDYELFDFFELSEEERDFIISYIPNWYKNDFKQ